MARRDREPTIQTRVLQSDEVHALILRALNGEKTSYASSTRRVWRAMTSSSFVGSPETVRQKLAHYQKELGVGVVLTGCQTGTLSHELARKSMELLAREVLPHTRGISLPAAAQ